jgi:O-antigen ligase
MKGVTYPNLFSIALALLAATMICLPKAVPLAIVLFALILILGYIKKQVYWKWYAPHVFSALLYVIYLVGIFYTENMNLAKGYAENKLSLFVFPLLLSIRTTFSFRLAPVLMGTAIGLTLVSLYGCYQAYLCYHSGGKLLTCLTSVSISPVHHPTYFATFLLVITFGIWHEYLHKESGFTLNWIVPFSMLAAAMFILCLSLAACLILGVLILAGSAWYVQKRWGRLVSIGLVVSSPFLLYLFLTYLPVVKDEVTYTRNSFATYMQGPVSFVKKKTGYKIGNEVRMVMWTVSVMEWRDHPFGVGTGNVDKHLSNRLKELGQIELAKQDEKGSIRYNPHNQFLQTGLETGLLGFLLLLSFVTSSLVWAHRNGHLFFLVILYSLVINCLFESMLQRQSGLVFYTFWIMLLMVFISQKHLAKNRPT